MSSVPIITSSQHELLDTLSVHHLEQIDPSWRVIAETRLSHPEADVISFFSTTLGSEQNDNLVTDRMNEYNMDGSRKEGMNNDLSLLLDLPLMRTFYDIVEIPQSASVFYKGQEILSSSPNYSPRFLPIFGLPLGSVTIECSVPFKVYTRVSRFIVRQYNEHNKDVSRK